MNLKRKINSCRKQGSYSVSFYFIFKSVDCNATAENVRIYVFRFFRYTTTKRMLTFLLRNYPPSR